MVRDNEKKRTTTICERIFVEAAASIGAAIRQAKTTLVSCDERRRTALSTVCTAINRMQASALQNNADSFIDLTSCGESCRIVEARVKRNVAENTARTLNNALVAIGNPVRDGAR